MSKIDRVVQWIALVALILSVIGNFVIFGYFDSERSKRIGLEAENERITSIIERVVKASMGTQHTIEGCYGYQSKISFLIAEYYGAQRFDPIDSIPDSLLAVPPKYIIDSITIENGDSIWFYTIDSSEVTE